METCVYSFVLISRQQWALKQQQCPEFPPSWG